MAAAEEKAVLALKRAHWGSKGGGMFIHSKTHPQGYPVNLGGG